MYGVSESIICKQYTVHLATCLAPYHALLEVECFSPKEGAREGWKEEMKDGKFKGGRKQLSVKC